MLEKVLGAHPEQLYPNCVTGKGVGSASDFDAAAFEIGAVNDSLCYVSAVR